MNINHFVHDETTVIVVRAGMIRFFNHFLGGSMLARFGKVLFGVGLAVMSAEALMGQVTDRWPVGVNCGVLDPVTGYEVEFTEVSSGPWVTKEWGVVRNDVGYLIRAEASNQYGWGVIAVKNLNTAVSRTSTGPVDRHEEFRLVFEGWDVRCKQWPYIAG